MRFFFLERDGGGGEELDCVVHTLELMYRADSFHGKSQV